MMAPAQPQPGTSDAVVNQRVSRCFTVFLYMAVIRCVAAKFDEIYSPDRRIAPLGGLPF